VKEFSEGRLIVEDTIAVSRISAEVFAKYQHFDQGNRNTVLGMASYLAASFGASAAFIDGMNIFQGLDQAPSGVFSALADVDDNLPQAFLNVILFDKNFTPVKFDFDQVSTAAKVPVAEEGDPFSHPHERLYVNVDIEKEGFIYIYVSNESDQDMEVYFDDLRVVHQYSDVVGGGDYYPFGLPIPDRQITRERYRYGYQGQFAEKDEETGWNHFELREYDPVVGRWLVPDIFKVHWSPFLSMNNNPVNLVDPDGGCETGNCPPKPGDIKDNRIFDGENWLPMGREAVVNFASDYNFFQQERPYVMDTQRHLNHLFNQPVIKTWEPGLIDRWSKSDSFLAKATYGTVDGAYVTLHFFTPWEPDVHLNGEATQGRDKVTAFASAATTIMPATRAIPLLNVAKFSTLFKGTLF